MMTTMPEKDGWLYMYYGWYPEQHNTFPQSSSITYLAKLPEDRFVGIQATGSGGVWTTSAITLSSDPGQLLVNAVVGGDLRVEILDASTMETLAGYSGSDGLSIGPGDYLDATARWSGEETLDSLAGRTVVLRFLMDDATVYSYRFQAVPEPSAIAMLLCGGACLIVLRQRRRGASNARRLVHFCCIGLLAAASVPIPTRHLTSHSAEAST
jgi:hypothetical protein